MKVSTRARYGFKFMLHLSMHYQNRLVQIREVADVENLSNKYLEQIAMSFKKSELVNVYRGAKGGYELARPPKEITLFEIMSSSEGEIMITDCVALDAACQRKSDCGMNKLWSGLNEHIVDYLKNKTLADIAL